MPPFGNMAFGLYISITHEQSILLAPPNRIPHMRGYDVRGYDAETRHNTISPC